MEYSLTVTRGGQSITVSANFEFNMSKLVELFEDKPNAEALPARKIVIVKKLNNNSKSWTEERRSKHSESMKKAWNNRSSK